MAVPEDAVGFGEDVDFAEVASEEAVEEGGFAGVDFAADDEEERAAEAVFGFIEGKESPEVRSGLDSEGGDAAHEARQPFASREIPLAEHVGLGLWRLLAWGFDGGLCGRRFDFHGQELGDGDEAVSLAEEAVDGGGHGVDGLGVEVVGEDDATSGGIGKDA